MPWNEFCDELIQDRLGQNNILGSYAADAPSCEWIHEKNDKAWLGYAERQQSVLSKQAGTCKY